MSQGGLGRYLSSAPVEKLQYGLPMSRFGPEMVTIESGKAYTARYLHPNLMTGSATIAKVGDSGCGDAGTGRSKLPSIPC